MRYKTLSFDRYKSDVFIITIMENVNLSLITIPQYVNNFCKPSTQLLNAIICARITRWDCAPRDY